MTRPIHILQVTDRKPGHENQSGGLIEALRRLIPVEIDTLDVSKDRPWLSRWLDAPQRRPDLIVGAGHRTHWPMLWWSRRFESPCAVLMKPSIPYAFFDLCVVPEHDLGGKHPPHHVIASKGALNRVPPPGELEKHGGLILVGGPSAAHGWDEGAVTEAVQWVARQQKDRPWRMSDSRRTPEGALRRLAKACPEVVAHAHSTTGTDWLPQRLAEAAEVWITADSVSMIYESLSSGARVGLLPTPVAKTGRVTRGIAKLIDEGWVTEFDTYRANPVLPEPPAILREADRCAARIMREIFPNRLQCPTPETSPRANPSALEP